VSYFIMLLIAKIIQDQWQMNEYGTLVEGQRLRNNEELGKNSVPVLPCRPQMSVMRSWMRKDSSDIYINKLCKK
jgi:hypothetical protein